LFLKHAKSLLLSVAYSYPLATSTGGVLATGICIIHLTVLYHILTVLKQGKNIILMILPDALMLFNRIGVRPVNDVTAHALFGMAAPSSVVVLPQG